MEVQFDGPELAEIDMSVEVYEESKARHPVGMAHPCWGEDHLTQTAGHRYICSPAHGATRRALDSGFHDDSHSSVPRLSRRL